MEQKDYKLEIINQLMKEKCHVRHLAKKLNINHMNILRKINELASLNVVDYKKEGKNKVYFLKKTTEARLHILMAENYKLSNTLKKYPQLRKIIDKIQNDNGIVLAILFGSYAKEIPKKESDIDIYIETTNKEIKKQLEKIDSKLSIKIGKYDKNNSLIKEIIKNHIIIKGIERYYEINEILKEN